MCKYRAKQSAANLFQIAKRNRRLLLWCPWGLCEEFQCYSSLRSPTSSNSPKSTDWRIVADIENICILKKCLNFSSELQIQVSSQSAVILIFWFSDFLRIPKELYIKAIIHSIARQCGYSAWPKDTTGGEESERPTLQCPSAVCNTLLTKQLT